MPWDQPYIVFWELTRACEFACKHCRAKAVKKRHEDELTTEECFKVIDDISKFELKPMIIFTGGDPLLREDVVSIIDYASKKGVRCSIAFSGTERANYEKMVELKNAGISRVAVSVDGFKEVHDQFRGVDGAFDMAMEVVRNCIKAGIEFQINTTVTKYTMKCLPELARLCLDLKAAMWDVFFLVPTGRAKVEQMPSAQEFEDILCWLYDLKLCGLNVKSSAATHFRRVEIMRQKGVMPKVGELYYELLSKTNLKPVGVREKINNGKIKTFGITDGRGMLFISHVGEVYPSGFLPLDCGNVRESSLMDIYKKSKVFCDLRDPEKLKGKCGKCSYKYICGGSRARAYALTGDYLSEEPCCVHLSN